MQENEPLAAALATLLTGLDRPALDLEMVAEQVREAANEGVLNASALERLSASLEAQACRATSAAHALSRASGFVAALAQHLREAGAQQTATQPFPDPSPQEDTPSGVHRIGARTDQPHTRTKRAPAR